MFTTCVDTWLHIKTIEITYRYFGDITQFPAQVGSSAPSDQYAAGWTTIGDCNTTLFTTLPQNRSAGQLPCSLNTTYDIYSLAHAPLVYLTLSTGIIQSLGFKEFSRPSAEDMNKTTDQIVTFVDPKTKLLHAMLFYVGAIYEYDSEDRFNNGIDFAADTTSMVTQCEFVTQACQLGSSKASTQQNASVPFNCSSIFYGDLDYTPLTGLERVSGWNTSFYELIDGVPNSIPVQAQSNPFYFNATAAVNSVSFSDILPGTHPEGAVIDASEGRIAFALSCSATIYDVTFSVVNGSFYDFNATRSNPQKASIIQAPLQVGFGQYHLYQSAAFAVLDENLLPEMNKAFSQTGMALASGAFIYKDPIAQRLRYDQVITQVGKTSFWFLVIMCLLYPTLGIAGMITALMLRRTETVKTEHGKLMSFVLTRKRSKEPDDDD